MLKGDSLEDLPEDFEVRMDQMDVHIHRPILVHFLTKGFLDICPRPPFPHIGD